MFQINKPTRRAQPAPQMLLFQSLRSVCVKGQHYVFIIIIIIRAQESPERMKRETGSHPPAVAHLWMPL
ncbi:hypothetical protein QQF64_005212 [Cirrhinus molitorella]|uniref:Uncharacterized protein n=1 Tax=Cirrhinus molitorella TaxID=172907 RepID=A0ABR3MIG9_9TELE